MIEILLIAATIFALPFLPHEMIWVWAVILIVLPGLFAMRGGPPYVPTPGKILRRMMAFAEIKPGEKVYDLGCGDGRLLIAAAKRGAIAVGYELSIPVYVIAKVRSFFHRNVRVIYGNFWKVKYADADVIVCYLVTDAMQTFERTIWPQLKPGCRVVSHAFKMRGETAAKDEQGVIMYVKR